MLKRILNCPERITYHRLREVCSRRSAHVYAKVRLADVLPIEGSGLPDGFYEFALRAHYDFVITDSTQNPLFAVEFDGPGHSDLAQVGRDTKKDELSRYFNLPLLRVIADDLHRSEWRLDRLTEAAERWFDGAGSATGDCFAGGSGSAVPSLNRSSGVAEKHPCPLCGSGMVVKVGKYGPFLSCARFPDCRGSSDLPGPSASPRHQGGGGRAASVSTNPRPWLIAGAVLIGLVLISLVAVVGRSNAPGPAPRSSPPIGSNAERSGPNSPAPIISGEDAATIRQMNFLSLLIRRRGWNASKRDAEIRRVLGYDRGYSELSKREASKLITALDDREK